MSNALGIVFSREESPRVLAYFEYWGTSDVCQSYLQPTAQKVFDEWRQEREWKRCTCGQPATPCLLFNEYGGGDYWSGEVCIPCRAITKNSSLDGLDEKEWDEIIKGDGRPDGKPTSYAIQMTPLDEAPYYPNAGWE